MPYEFMLFQRYQVVPISFEVFDKAVRVVNVVVLNKITKMAVRGLLVILVVVYQLTSNQSKSK